MAEQPQGQHSDLFGLAPFGEAANTLAKGAVDGANAFLGRICLPAAEELGLLLRDRVGLWRTQNTARILLKAERLLKAKGGYEGKHANPRVVFRSLEEGSWVTGDGVRDMWAGLLASSCSDDGSDESNLIFINLLSQLTTAEARILNHSCQSAVKKINAAGGITAGDLMVGCDELMSICGIKDDFNHLDRELDHLRTLGILVETGGFPDDSAAGIADVTPTALSLNLYVRCQGSRETPLEYFQLAVSDQPPTG